MSSILHVLGAVVRWLYAHLAAVGISAVFTAIGGVIMWGLGFRKAKLSNEKLRLEIDHIKIDTDRLRLEVDKLTAEQAQRAQVQKLSALTDQLIAFAKERKRQNQTGSAVAFTEQYLCSEMKESPEAITKALHVLLDRHLTKHSPGGGGTWIFDL
jgi:hypothetical protein